MALKVFFEANVLLDFLLDRSDQSKELTRIFQWADEGKIAGYWSISVIQICSYYICKAKGVATGKELFELMLEKFALISGDRQTVTVALKSSQSDIEDAIHYFMALENGIDIILTSDQDFQKLSSNSLKILSVKELEGFCSEHF
jgi:predicted nucleic acid-binding protein